MTAWSGWRKPHVPPATTLTKRTLSPFAPAAAGRTDAPASTQRTVNTRTVFRILTPLLFLSYRTSSPHRKFLTSVVVPRTPWEFGGPHIFYATIGPSARLDRRVREELAGS